MPFEREISVIAARGRDGAIAAYDLGRERPPRRHPAHLDRARRGLRRPTAEAARDRRARSSTALDYVGVIGVEFFVLGRRRAAGQRDRAARPQFRPLDRATPAPSRSSSSTSAPSPAGRSARPTRHSDVRDGEPDRRRGRRLAGAARRARARMLHLYGKREAGPAARWAMSPGSRPRVRPDEQRRDAGIAASDMDKPHSFWTAAIRRSALRALRLATA